MNRLCSMLAWTPSAVVGPISSTVKASVAWRIASEARSRTDGATSGPETSSRRVAIAWEAGDRTSARSRSLRNDLARDGRFLRVELLPFFPELLPIGRSLQTLESNHFGHERTALPGPEVRRFDSASVPLRLVIVSTAVDGFPCHIYPTLPPAPRFVPVLRSEINA